LHLAGKGQTLTGERHANSGPILVVDDDEVLRALLSVTLASAGFRVLEAATGEEALELARREPPRLIVLDVCLPGVSGYHVCHELRTVYGEGLPIIFISGVQIEPVDRVAGLVAGADEYLAKPFAPDELLIRVDRLTRRSSIFPPLAAAALTRREQEILSLLADGLSAREISERLYISPNTVATHVENILRKMGVRSRTQAIALAYREALIGAPVAKPATSA
jgi:DNA-binding NarL/FixJ family response regulator